MQMTSLSSATEIFYSAPSPLLMEMNGYKAFSGREPTDRPCLVALDLVLHLIIPCYNIAFPKCKKLAAHSLPTNTNMLSS